MTDQTDCPVSDTITVRMTCGVCKEEVPVVVARDAKVGTAAEAMLRVHDPTECERKNAAGGRF